MGSCGGCPESLTHYWSLLIVGRIERSGLVINLIAQRARAVDEAVAGVVDIAHVRAGDRIAPGGVGVDDGNAGIAIHWIYGDVRQVRPTGSAVVNARVDQVIPAVGGHAGGLIVTMLDD